MSANRKISEIVAKSYHKIKLLEYAFLRSRMEARQTIKGNDGLIEAVCELAKQKNDELIDVVRSNNIVKDHLETATVEEQGSHVTVTMPVNAFEFIKLQASTLSNFKVDELKDVSEYVFKLQMHHARAFEEAEREEDEQRRRRRVENEERQ